MCSTLRGLCHERLIGSGLYDFPLPNGIDINLSSSASLRYYEILGLLTILLSFH